MRRIYKYDKYILDNHQDMTVREMAEKLDASVMLIYKICWRLKCTPRKGCKSNNRKDFTEVDKIITEKRNNGLTVPQIAKLINKKPYFVQNRCGVLGLTTYKEKSYSFNSSGGKFFEVGNQNWLI